MNQGLDTDSQLLNCSKVSICYSVRRKEVNTYKCTKRHCIHCPAHKQFNLKKFVRKRVIGLHQPQCV